MSTQRPGGLIRHATLCATQLWNCHFCLATSQRWAAIFAKKKVVQSSGGQQIKSKNSSSWPCFSHKIWVKWFVKRHQTLEGNHQQFGWRCQPPPHPLVSPVSQHHLAESLLTSPTKVTLNPWSHPSSKHLDLKESLTNPNNCSGLEASFSATEEVWWFKTKFCVHDFMIFENGGSISVFATVSSCFFYAQRSCSSRDQLQKHWTWRQIPRCKQRFGDSMPFPTLQILKFPTRKPLQNSSANQYHVHELRISLQP